MDVKRMTKSMYLVVDIIVIKIRRKMMGEIDKMWLVWWDEMGMVGDGKCPQVCRAFGWRDYA